MAERERIARLLYEANHPPADWAPFSMVAGGEYHLMADAVLAARDRENAERDQDMFVTLRAQLVTARERIAALEKVLGTIEYWDRADVANSPTDVRVRMGKLAREALAPTADQGAPDEEPDPALLATLKQQVFGN